MTGTPCEIALATDGLMAVPSWARITSTLAPWEMRFSTLLACVSADDLASFEMYDAAAGLDRRLERRLVPLRPALLLVVVPGHADDAVATGSTASGGGAGRLRAAAPVGCRGCGAAVPSAAVARAGGTSPSSSSSSPQATRTRAALTMSAADRRACMRVSSPVACGGPDRIR